MPMIANELRAFPLTLLVVASDSAEAAPMGFADVEAVAAATSAAIAASPVKVTPADTYVACDVTSEQVTDGIGVVLVVGLNTGAGELDWFSEVKLICPAPSTVEAGFENDTDLLELVFWVWGGGWASIKSFAFVSLGIGSCSIVNDLGIVVVVVLKVRSLVGVVLWEVGGIGMTRLDIEVLIEAGGKLSYSASN
jgi:hypothetical protein